MTKEELIEAIQHLPDNTEILFSIADDKNPYPFLRAFANKIHTVEEAHGEASIQLLGSFNNDLESQTKKDKT